MILSPHEHAAPPVYKVGGVLLRRLATGAPEVLIAQPRPKRAAPHDMPPMGLPRGTRRYAQVVNGVETWLDARDAATAIAHAQALEPLAATLASELHEEAGLRPEWLATLMVVDLGAHIFPSASKAPYAVQWFAVMVDDATEQKRSRELLKDSEFTEWVSMEELAERAQRVRGTPGHVNRGYVPVAEMALAALSSLHTSP
jgi:hypothetical protein